MTFFDTLRFKLATLFGRERMDAEMDDELRSHIEHRADDLERNGWRGAKRKGERGSSLAAWRNLRSRAKRRPAGRFLNP